MSTATTTEAIPAHITREFFHDLLADYPSRDVAVRLWDGTTWGDGNRCTLVLRHPGALRHMFFPSRVLTLCEAYLHDDFDIEGDIEAFWRLAQHLYAGEESRPLLRRKPLEARLSPLPEGGAPRRSAQVASLDGPVHSAERDARAVAPHYSTSNDFYSLWLGRAMVYSCAYFTASDQDIDTAQEQKLDYICRKLRLKPGERLLDIGCGWGGLVIHAARHYGVHAVGMTITPPQAEWARRRIREDGLEALCEIRLCDYRAIVGETFDKLASVGFQEHVGGGLYEAYFRQAWNLVRPGGAFLNHAIVQRPTKPLPIGWSFIYRHVFPESELHPVTASLQAAEQVGWEVRDVESLREHYALTLLHRRQRLEARADEARKVVDDFTYRVFRLYLSGAGYGFTVGQPNVYQSLLVKPDGGVSGMPLTRADWYA